MMTVVLINAYEVVKELAGLPKAFSVEMAHSFTEGSKAIVGMFQRDQLSGRKADDTGLNIKSRRLYESLWSGAQVVGDTVAAEIGNQGATYWEYHQTGTGRLPKRLFFDEVFHAKGREIYTSLAEAAFDKVAA